MLYPPTWGGWNSFGCCALGGGTRDFGIAFKTLTAGSSGWAQTLGDGVSALMRGFDGRGSSGNVSESIATRDQELTAVRLRTGA